MGENFLLVEILTATITLFLYLKLPIKLLRVDNLKSLIFNFVFVVICIGVFIYLAVKINSYSIQKIGIGLSNIKSAIIYVLPLTLVSILSLWAIAKFRKNRPKVSRNLIRLLLIYPLWAYIQQLLVLGLFGNWVADYFGIMTAVLLVGTTFGLMHWGDHLLFSLSFFIGICWALVFFSYPNLVPIAISHGFLATFYYYWIKKTDKWEEIFGSRGAYMR